MKQKILSEVKNSKNFFSFSFLYLLGYLISALIPLAIAKFLNPEGFGVYSLSIMIVFLFLAILITSSQTPFVISANKEFKDTKKIRKSFTILLLFGFISIVIFTLFLLIFNQLIIKFITADSQIILIFLFLGFAGYSLKSILHSLFLGLDKKNAASSVEVVFGISKGLLLIYFFFFGTLTINSIFLMYFISGVITFIFFLSFLDKKILFPLKFERNLFAEVFNFTKWQIFGLTAVYFINHGDNLILRLFVSVEEIGVYNLAYKFFAAMITASFLVNSYFLPFISQNLDNKEKIRNYLYKKRPKIYLLFVIGFIFSLFFIPFLIRYLYGNEYSQSINVFRILTISLFFNFYSVFYIPLFNCFKKYKFIQMSNLIQVCLNLILDLLLVFFLGLVGAAIATTTSYVIRSIANEIYFRKKIKSKII